MEETNIDQSNIKRSHPSDKIRFIDLYIDARSFLEKANSTKFIIVAFTLMLSPILLVTGNISEEVYRELVIIISLTYLGVDVYERKSMIKQRNNNSAKDNNN